VRDEPSRLGMERCVIQNARWSAKVEIHPKTLREILLAWDFGMSTEDALRA
jgi:hypothetical protein